MAPPPQPPPEQYPNELHQIGEEDGDASLEKITNKKNVGNIPGFRARMARPSLGTSPSSMVDDGSRGPSLLQQIYKQKRQAKRRNDCKVNQKKYRDRKRKENSERIDHIQERGAKVNALKMHNSMLKMQLDLAKAHRCNARLKLFEESMSLFARGIVDAKTTQRQWDFIRSMVREDCIVQFEKLRGPPAIFWQLILYSELYDDCIFQMVDSEIKNFDASIVSATYQCSVCLKRETLDLIHPGLESNRHLFESIVGKKLMLKVVVTYFFDSDENSNKVFRINIIDDWVLAWTRLVNNPHDVNILTESCRRQDCMLMMSPHEELPIDWKKVPGLVAESIRTHGSFVEKFSTSSSSVEMKKAGVEVVKFGQDDLEVSVAVEKEKADEMTMLLN